MGAQTKRPKTYPKDGKVPGTKHPEEKTSQGTKRLALITKFSKTNFMSENWPCRYIC